MKTFNGLTVKQNLILFYCSLSLVSITGCNENNPFWLFIVLAINFAFSLFLCKKHINLKDIEDE